MTSPCRVSLCMIVRNEENNLRPCLEPIASLFHEIVVVDTGSTDGTKALAAEMGAAVFDFAWCEDFAAARNESLRRATGDWVLWLDADDRLDAANSQRLRELLAQLGEQPQAYFMDTVSAPQASQKTVNLIPHCRLFRRHPEARWERRVHEQIVPSLERLGYPLVPSAVQIQHLGYQDPIAYHRKANRNLRLLRLEYATDPSDPYVLFNLGLVNLQLGRSAEALTYLLSSLKLVAACKADWVRRLYADLVDALLRLQRYAEALAITAEGLVKFPIDPILTTRRADLLRQNGSFGEAERCLLLLLRSPRGSQRQAGSQAILDRQEARYLLGIVYLEQGRYLESERVFQELLAQYPIYLEGWIGLSYIYLNQQRFRDVDFVARQLEKCPNGSIFATVLRSEALLVQGQFGPARTLLDQAIARAPGMVWARIVLGDLLMKSGADVSACIAAQRDILRMDPGNFCAKKHLQYLEQAQHRTPQNSSLWFSVTT